MGGVGGRRGEIEAAGKHFYLFFVETQKYQERRKLPKELLLATKYIYSGPVLKYSSEVLYLKSYFILLLHHRGKYCTALHLFTLKTYHNLIK